MAFGNALRANGERNTEVGATPVSKSFTTVLVETKSALGINLCLSPTRRHTRFETSWRELLPNGPCRASPVQSSIQFRLPPKSSTSSNFLSTPVPCCPLVSDLATAPTPTRPRHHEQEKHRRTPGSRSRSCRMGWQYPHLGA